MNSVRARPASSTTFQFGMKKNTTPAARLATTGTTTGSRNPITANRLDSSAGAIIPTRAKATFSPGFTVPIFWRVVRTAPKDQDPAAIAAAVKALDGKLDIAEAQLSRHPFLAGETFTPADIQFGHLLYRYFTIDIERRPRPVLERYYKTLMERPAFQEHVMVSYEELRAK